MRVLMLGWEFPPFISGGLGTACYGLTKALGAEGCEITFVLPKQVDGELTSHVNLLSPQDRPTGSSPRTPGEVASTFKYEQELPAETKTEAFAHVEFKAVPAKVPSVYQGHNIGIGSPEQTRTENAKIWEQQREGVPEAGGEAIRTNPRPGAVHKSPQQADSFGTNGEVQSFEPGSDVEYSGDLLGAAKRYAGLCRDLARTGNYDIIHGHDWLTYPAGAQVAQLLGIPFIAHVHSTEFDRAGENINETIYAIERDGVQAATCVIAVSHLTKSILINRYNVPAEKIHVVYNGVDNGVVTPLQTERPKTIAKDDRIVLFLGRITMQKGPEYFVEAAKKVLSKRDNVKFIMAGSGDKMREVISLAAKEGIANKILFTGFLRGDDVQKVYQLADVYVMPSVSEPFGIAALEAMRQDVPVIVSKTAGVAEVVNHALKVDFWDTKQIADRILAVLNHPVLAAELRKRAEIDVRKLTWDDAARKCAHVYDTARQSVMV
ncbi:glycosyltransferase [Poriferisphaera sp. WC338]|uniref:glycosyltransferase n=1 Tax=Poriferisphaera sp. WC338 TaxID=3425129 RepID=UPI003D819731